MKNKLDLIGVIPVKERSERVKGKNLRKFSNTNLYELKISQLKKTKNFSKFMVSSESKKILKIAKNLKVETHYRNKKLSNDYIGIIPVVKEVIKDYKKKGEKYKKVCCVFPT